MHCTSGHQSWARTQTEHQQSKTNEQTEHQQTIKKERDIIARFRGNKSRFSLAPITEGVGDFNVGEALHKEGLVDDEDEWTRLADKYGEFAENVEPIWQSRRRRRPTATNGQPTAHTSNGAM